MSWQGLDLSYHIVIGCQIRAVSPRITFMVSMLAMSLEDLDLQSHSAIVAGEQTSNINDQSFQSASNAAVTQTSPTFQGLPDEIRRLVYLQLFAHAKLWVREEYNPPQMMVGQGSDSQWNAANPPPLAMSLHNGHRNILYTNSDVNKEAAVVLYSSIVLDVGYSFDIPKDLPTLLCQKLRHVVLPGWLQPPQLLLTTLPSLRTITLRLSSPSAKSRRLHKPTSDSERQTICKVASRRVQALMQSLGKDWKFAHDGVAATNSEGFSLHVKYEVCKKHQNGLSKMDNDAVDYSIARCSLMYAAKDLGIITTRETSWAILYASAVAGLDCNPEDGGAATASTCLSDEPVEDSLSLAEVESFFESARSIRTADEFLVD